MANRKLYFPQLLRRHTYSRFSRYKQYKHEIREDCQGRCVYCDLHENELGGLEFMSLDHFRPQTLYAKLKNNPTNLVWSCRLCNENKGNIWPACGTPDTYVATGGFVDPFTEDMHEYFDVSADGKLIPLKNPAHFMIRILKLNRDGACRKRMKRRTDFESRQRSLKVLRLAIRQADDALEHPELPSELRESLLAQKERLSKEYDAVLADHSPDFTLR